MRAASRLGLPVVLGLALAAGPACTREGPDLALKAARPAVDPGVPAGELGRAGDRLLEASAKGTWIAVCRGERGSLILDPEHAITFHTLVGHDEVGRFVIVADDPPAARERLVDTWTRTTTELTGSSPNLSRDGRRLATTVGDAVVIRELATGEERRIDGVDGAHGRLDPGGRFLYLIKVIVRDPEVPGPTEPGSCEPIRGEEAGRMGRVEHTIVALDEPGAPRYRVPRGASPVRGTFGGGPLLRVMEPPQIQRWTPRGVETLIEDDAWLDPDDLRATGFVFGASTPEGESHWVRYADGELRTLAPLSTEDNLPAPDAYLVGAEAGVARATEGRFVDLESGAVVQAAPETPHAYAHGDRMLLLGDGVATLVDPVKGAILHRYETGARPSLARGGWVALRGGAGAVVLDLARPGFVARIDGPAVALTDGGAVLVAAGPAAAQIVETTGPFQWRRADR
ncbi:MAG: hypothetical protein R3B09_00045 [Nannocystaceae bacterium]